jgi:hypothetical protein
MGQLLCQDIFNQIIQYVHYQNRPQSLTINKQLNTFYTNSYLIQDKQTFSNLNDILTNTYFFNLLLGTENSIENGIDYRPYIKTQPQHIINLLHSYAFMERTMQKIGSHNNFLIPVSCMVVLKWDYWMNCVLPCPFPKHLQAILTFLSNATIPNKISYVDFFQSPCFKHIIFSNNKNVIFLNSKIDNDMKLYHGFLNYSSEEEPDTEYHDFPNYESQQIPENYNMYTVSDNFNKLHATNDTTQQYWDIFHNSSKDPQTTNILNFLKEYEATIRKIEM